MDATPVQLTQLLDASTFYRLAYALPLLLSSVVVTFAGTFLTLDRTRSVANPIGHAAPLSDAFEADYFKLGITEEKAWKGARKWKYRLNGGVGGLLGGYLCGLHAATFMSLFIPNTTSTSTLSPTAFFVIWFLSVIPVTVFGSRWRLAALLCLGLTSGISFSLSLGIIAHPSLNTRTVIAAVCTPLFMIATVMPSVPFLRLKRYAHTPARVSTACAGAFALTLSTSILARSRGSPSWANAWDRLWVADGVGWGIGAERGFSVLFCVLWALGAATDWALRRKLGDSADEVWDDYLAQYSSAFPHERNRAGVFRPQSSLWKRILMKLGFSKSTSSSRPQDILFPSDAELGFAGRSKAYPDPAISRDAVISPFLLPPPTPRADFLNLIREKSKGAKVQKGRGRGFSHDESKHDEFDLGDLKLTRIKTQLQRLNDRRNPSSKAMSQDDERGALKPRNPLRFRPANGYSGSDSSDSTESDSDTIETPLNTPSRPKLVERSGPGSGTSLSGTTVRLSASDRAAGALDADSERAHIQQVKAAFGFEAQTTTVPDARSPGFASPVDYSDVEVEESDVTAALARAPSPARRSLANAAARHALPLSRPPSPPQGAVPMTPSLVYALRRIAVAQQQAFGPVVSSPGVVDGVAQTGERARLLRPDPIPGLPVPQATQVDGPAHMPAYPPVPVLAGASGSTPALVSEDDDDGPLRWEGFWRDVQVQATATEADLSRGMRRVAPV